MDAPTDLPMTLRYASDGRVGTDPVDVVTAKPVPVRVETNGRIHLRYEIGDRTVDDGRCNIDENWVVTTWNEVGDADRDRLCLFCWPLE
jgi:hypothetical protein